LQKYGEVGGGLSENIAYGNGGALKTILQFIVDDGVPGRGHRLAIFSPSFYFYAIA